MAARLALAELELLKALVADQFALEEVHIARVVAKNARGMVFLQDNLVAFGEDFERVLDGDIHRFAKLDRDHDTA